MASSFSNLIGRIEQRIRGGETITDFTRIRAGALYKANGGYLVIDAQDILRSYKYYLESFRKFY